MTNILNYFDEPKDITNKDNILYLNGTTIINGIIFSSIKLGNILISNDITIYTTPTAVNISGKALLVTTTTGYNMTLAAPSEGCLCCILGKSIEVGNSIVITTEEGVTFDGTNNSAGFAETDDELILGYKSATEWQIFKNKGVVLNST